MTDRIERMFEKKKKEGRKALITFVTAGDPDIGTTIRLVLEMEKAGADLIELGIPFSDPVAEGPVIQKANVRALSKGLKVEDIFKAVSELRKLTEVPIVYLLYANTVFHMGKSAFFKRCAQSGVDGVIVPDLPYEEKGEISQEATEAGVRVISLVAPTSHDRIKKIAGVAEGFLYCVSSLGVTGERKSFQTDFESFFSLIRSSTKIPAAIGFGISTPEQAAKFQKYADGVIVGSAIVHKVGDASSPDEAVKSVSEFVSTLRKAMDA